jgi:hypothetical protein
VYYKTTATVLLGQLSPEAFIALTLYSSFDPVGCFVNFASLSASPPASKLRRNPASTHLLLPSFSQPYSQILEAQRRSQNVFIWDPVFQLSTPFSSNPSLKNLDS